MRVQDGVSYGDMFLGVVMGILIGWGVTYLWQELEPLINPLLPDYVCQKGIAFQATEYGSNIYLKTGQACIDTTFGEEMK